MTSALLAVGAIVGKRADREDKFFYIKWIRGKLAEGEGFEPSIGI